MSRRHDLETRIRESYCLIEEYEEIIRLSDRPKEKLRAKRKIEAQWKLIEGYLAAYLPLAGEGLSDDIAPISQRAQRWPGRRRIQIGCRRIDSRGHWDHKHKLVGLQVGFGYCAHIGGICQTRPATNVYHAVSNRVVHLRR